MEKKKIYRMAVYAMFIALIFVLGMTPIGLIPLPWAAVTTLHIPVIVGAVIFGVKGGALLGFSFGLTTLIRCFTAPDVIGAIVLGTYSGSGFGLRNLAMVVLILIIPRILVGVVAALLYRLLSRFDKTSTWSVSVSALAGSLTNSVLVLGMLALLAFSEVEEVLEVTGASAVVGTLVTANLLNVVLEAAAAIILCTAICKALFVFMKKRNPELYQ